jgi:hypothetical protein
LVIGAPWTEILGQQLKAADLVIGVFTDAPNANVAFEIGFAIGSGRPALLLVAPEAKDLPFDLASHYSIRARPDNTEAIAFALDTFAKSSTRSVPTTSGATASVVSKRRIDDYEHAVGGLKSEREVVKLLHNMLVDAGMEAVSEARIGGRHIDLAAWSDALGPYLGNPILFEVKEDISDPSACRRAIAQLTTYVRSAGGLWGFLVYVKGPQREFLERELRMASQILAVSIDELIAGARSGSIANVLIAARNRKVHGVPG